MHKLKRFKSVEASRHDQLVQQRVRLLASYDQMRQLINSLREIRELLNESYKETKRLRLPWERYRILNNITEETIAAYDQIETLKSTYDREEIVTRCSTDCVLDVYIENETDSSENDPEDKRSIAAHNRELQMEVEHLKIELVRIRQVYQNEASAFIKLSVSHRSLEKYGLIQRYLMLKFIVKTAAKSDV